MGASAAYWAASQATRIYLANETTLGASLGTFGVIEDSSGQAAQDGVKVHVIRAGEYKGSTVAGAPVEHKTLVYWQELVDDQNEQFIRAVAAGRNLTLSRARELFDGRAHVGQKLIDMGLADGVQSFDETVAQLQKKAASTTARRPKAMSVTEATPAAADIQPRPATIHELKQGCPGADDSFVCAQLTANVTLSQAQTAWMAEQNSRLQKAKAEAEQAKAAAAKPGTQPLTTAGGPVGAEAEGGATERWLAIVEANKAKGMRNDKAVRAAAVANPALHKAYIAEYNADTLRRRAERAAAAEAEQAARAS
jgi:ClpP class serine protease